MFDSGDDLLFLNHGLAPTHGGSSTIDLPGSLEKHRHQIQLYRYLADRVAWGSMDAVEVSSGRGGGAAHLFDVCRPRSMLGIDLSVASVNFCKTEHRNRDRLSFMVGDAHDLPLGNASCDILINVESSLNYRDQDRFFVEVDRVLRPGGHFLFADYRRAKGMSKLQNRLDRMGYEQVHVEDISAGIANAIELDNPGKQERLKRRIPRLLRGLVAAFTFTGAAGRDEVARFRSGEKRYLCAVLRKPQRADTSLVRPAPERNPAVTA